jgi:hypothetical protein
MHVHSAAGGHSTGTYPDIIQAAKQAGYRWVFVTEHPKPRRLFNRIADEQIVMIYGFEQPRGAVHVLEDEARRTAFLADAPSSDPAPDVDGFEVFNLHESAKSRDSWFNRLNYLYHRVFFPDAFFFRLFEINPARLRAWDRVLATRPFAGVAGTDAHHNLGLILQTAEGKKLLEWRIDPYTESFRSVSTHVILRLEEAVTADSVLTALKTGASYVAFERIADARGFSFHALADDKAWPPGSRLKLGARLKAQSPIAARFALIHAGRLVGESTGVEWIIEPRRPGAYRLEVYPLTPPSLLAGKPWIITNPIYLTGSL